jgi:hypothetical protein
VGGDRGEIDLEPIDVQREGANALGGVGMEDDAVAAGDGTDLGEWLDGADLVVGVHDRDQDGPCGEGLLDLGGVNAADAVDGQVGDREAGLLEVGADGQHRLVLDRRGDQVIAVRAQRHGCALDSEVVALCSAGGEHDLLLCAGAEQSAELPAGDADGGSGFLAVAVATGGVPERGGEVGQHRLKDPRVEGCRGLVVQVDRAAGHRPAPAS